jgi:hypothetical protein
MSQAQSSFEIPAPTSDLSLPASNNAYGRWHGEYLQVAQSAKAVDRGEPDQLIAGPLKGLEISASGPLQEHIKSFAEQHKLSVAVDHGQLAYSLSAAGKTQELFRTAVSDAGLAEGKNRLRALCAQEQEGLTKTYHVAFAKDGEVVGKYKESVYAAASAGDVTARDPELFELAGVKAALERSVPGNLGKDGNGVKFYFLAGKLIQSINPLATFQPDKDGRSSVYLWPAVADINRATEADLTAKERKLPFTDSGRPETVAGAVTHELGHNQFAKLGYNRPGTSPDGQTEVTDKGKQLYNAMGWQRRRDEKDADYNWFLVGKSKDNNGQPATYMPSNTTGMAWSFLRWRLDGGAVDQQGKGVPADKGQSLSTDEMAKEAVVPLPTSYFENPEEEYAESVKLFRLGTEGRTALRDTSPKLYKIIERNDQTEINAAYGVGADGGAKMIRDVDGRLVSNTAEEERRRAVFDAEAGQ